MNKINWKSIGCVVGEVGKIVLSGVGLYALAKVSENTNPVINTEPAYVGTYNKAVEAIMSSDLYSYQKSEAVAVLSRDEDSDYYLAVITIIESDMFSHEKLKLIKQLTER